MSKKTKKSRSAFKLETLEQRQLLATIVAGSGTEVNSDVKLANGNTYDQILMTGSSVTVDANAGQVTRIDFLDADGDIARVEFSGKGQLTVSLADFKEAAAPTEYTTDTKYVQGKASIQITGSDETTNVTIYSLGTANVNGGASNAIFAGGKDGGNNVANVSRLVIEDNGSVLGNAFGGIRAGNAVFGDSTGATGIAAPNIQFQGPIVIGGIFESGTAVGLLNIGQFSSNKTVTVVGTDLKDAKIESTGVTKITFGTGTTSMGKVVETVAINANAFTSFNGVTADVGGKVQADVTAAVNGAVTYTSSALTVTLDGNTTTDDLTALAKRFLNEVIIKDDFDAGAFSAQLIGKLTIEGDLNDSIESKLGIGDVSVSGTIDGGTILAAGAVGAVSFGEDVDLTGGYAPDQVIKAASVGNITFAGDVDAGAEKLVVATGNIGNVSAGAFTASGAVLASTGGKIGNLVFTGDVDLTGGSLSAKGIGNISGKNVTTGTITTISGASLGNISATGDLVLGAVTSAKAVGSISATGNVTINGIATGSEGSVGSITSGKTLTIDGAVTSAGSIGAISGADVNVNDAVSAVKAIGDISVTGSDSDLDIAAASGFSAGTTLGKVTVASGAIVSSNVTTAEFAANQIGDVSVTGHKTTAVLLSDVIFAAADEGASIGNITLNASANAAGIVAASAAASTTAITGTGFSSSGNIGNITITGTEGGKLLEAAGDVLLFRAGSSTMGAADADTTATAVSIGNVSIEANLTSLAAGPGQGLIIASGVTPAIAGEFVLGDTSIKGAARTTGVNGTIGSVSLTELGGAGTTGFTGNALANSGAFSGGSVIIANAIGEVTIEAGDSVTMAATGTARKGALDTNTDGTFGGAAGEADLFVIVL